MRVLSLFDGMGCGKVALKRAGIPVKVYYASEIDKYAIKVSKANHPDIIHLGDVRNWRLWNLGKIDLIIAGSPCQGFSFAGKQLNFDDPRSKLFFVFVDILKHYKPEFFLLENVLMKAEYNDVISSTLGDIYPECVEQFDLFNAGRLEPIEINSALVSAQNRKRLYWCNWKVEQPEDKGILLKDILDYNVTDKLSEKEMNYMQNSNPKWSNGKKRIDIYGTTENKKSLCLTANMHKGVPYGIVGYIPGFENNKSSKIQKRILKNICSLDGKGNCMLATQYKGAANNGATVISTDNLTWRKLTPLECERLQTLPDNYTHGISNSQRYKMLGNGWTVDVIAGIFEQMKNNNKLRI